MTHKVTAVKVKKYTWVNTELRIIVCYKALV